MDNDSMPPFDEWPPIPLAAEQAAGTPRPAYTRRGDEIVLGGRVMQAEGGQYTSGRPWLLGIMPDGLRPDIPWVDVAAIERGAGVYMARLEVDPDGSIVARTPPGDTSTSEGLHWISLNGITYPLPQSAATAA